LAWETTFLNTSSDIAAKIVILIENGVLNKQEE
jgi:hypothetical protein